MYRLDMSLGTWIDSCGRRRRAALRPRTRPYADDAEAASVLSRELPASDLAARAATRAARRAPTASPASRAGQPNNGE